MTLSESQVRLLTINEFAKVCRTTPRTLRFYEQKGLFKPAVVDQWNKYRFYDPKQARNFLKIKLLQNFHIPLRQISKTFEKRAAEEYLKKRLNELQEEIREKEKEYGFLQKIKTFLFNDELHTRHSGKRSASRIPMAQRDSGQARMTNNVFQSQTFGPYNLFCMRIEHGEYARITDYIKKLWKEAKRLKLRCENSEITFYLNNAYSPKNTPFEIALILRAKPRSARRSREVNNLTMKQSSNDFYFKTYPKTKALAFDYIGPHEYLILVYQKLFSYIEESKINLKGLVFEIYKYGPLNTKSKYDYQTTIGFPI